jgi:DNA-binding response OmpR family regulator
MASHSLARRIAEAEYVGRILVIADEVEVVDAVTEYFADLGYEAHGAIDDPDALAIVRRSAPELVLLDVPEPRLGDLFRQLRAARDIPIIIATENAETARQLRPLGAFAYVHKPFNWDDLRRRVAMVLYSVLRAGERRA